MKEERAPCIISSPCLVRSLLLPRQDNLQSFFTLLSVSSEEFYRSQLIPFLSTFLWIAIQENGNSFRTFTQGLAGCSSFSLTGAS